MDEREAQERVSECIKRHLEVLERDPRGAEIAAREVEAQMMQSRRDATSAAARDNRRAKQRDLQSNAEYQRKCNMSKDDRIREAKQAVEKNVAEHMKRTNPRATQRDVDKYMEKLTERYVKEIDK